MKEQISYTTKEKSSSFDVVMPLLNALYLEFKDLSKKKPDDVASISKIKLVNRLLMKIRIILADENSLELLDVFNEDDIPLISDVVLQLSQYVAAMKSFKARYYGYSDILTESTWFTGK